MTEPAFFDVVLSQRACRSFTDEPVPADDVTRMIEAATHAPSAENSQPWEFVVVRSPAARAAVDELTRRIWEGGGRAHAEKSVSARLLAEVDGFFGGAYGGAPVLIVVAGDSNAVLSPDLLPSSVYPAVQNLLLAAAALGYGSSMTTLATHAPGPLRAAVALAEHMVPMAVIPIGRPARTLGPPRRKPPSDVTREC